LLNILPKIFPQPLLQAIALGDVDQVRALLSSGYSQGHVVTDEDGISALAYAAGQGNEQILSLLFQYPAYQDDAMGIEQAIEIVTSRLRGLKPDTKDYQKYNHILHGLIEQIKKLHEHKLEVILRGYKQQNPDFSLNQAPIEMLQKIMSQMLGDQDIAKLAYPHIASGK
ncbi:MAG TPA: ankyrin repeat domain-containing protein, partial [Candidatus Babeliaceae bacterium]|nr:ankyrin repeat domain-containing protein [Candidatus Babeliaceae bacterium]